MLYILSWISVVCNIARILTGSWLALLYNCLICD